MMALRDVWARWEAFLKLDRLDSESDLLRARVVYGCALMFAALEVFVFIDLWTQYGGFHPHHIVAALAVVIVGAVPLLLRRTVSGGVFAVVFTGLVFSGILAAVLTSSTPPIGSGVDTPFLPLLVIACALIAWLGSWRPVVLYVAGALALVWGLHAMSLRQLEGAGLGASVEAALRMSFRQNAVQASTALLVAGAVAAPFGHTLYKLLDRLEQAAEKAREMDRLKSAFHANMNHEIRSPLSGILGMSEVLSLTKLDPHQRKCVDLISECGDGLLRILGEVLDVAKIDEGQLHLSSAPFDVKATMESLIALHRPNAASRRIWMGVEYPDDLPTRVVGDEARLRQVLGNLLGNAVKFTKMGGIRVAAEGVREGHDLVLTFTVQDTGCGIAEEDYERVFQRYRQSAAGVAQGSGGTGLGLSIARDIVRLMGGDIRVVSRVDYGTAFSFTLRMPIAADAGVAVAA